MYIKNPEIEINPEDPFKADQLDRLESAEALTEFVASLDGPFVLCIDSSWGTGKTTFVKMWQQHLKNQSFQCLYFNAWEHDFYSDPLIPFVGEMQSEIVSSLDETHTKAREYFEKVKRISGSIARKAIPAAVKIATAGLLDLSEITEEVLADYAQETIDSYEADRRTLKEFRENLEKFVAELSKNNQRPFVFFIDELDRCRPTYAVELLERVKHLFSVPGIVFVIVLDREQLAHSVKALYGAGMDDDGYLRRFFDLEYQLPEASVERYSRYLFHRFGFAEFFDNRRDGRSEGGQLLTVFIQLAEMFDFSLRVQEQCFTQFSIALRTTPKKKVLFPLFLAFLIALKTANRTLYSQYVKGEAPPKKVIEFIEQQPGGRDFFNDYVGGHVEAYIVSGPYGHHEPEVPIAEYTAKINDAPTEEERDRYGRVLAALNRFETRLYHNKVLDYLAKKIDVLERFAGVVGVESE